MSTIFNTEWIFSNIGLFVLIFFLIVIYIRNGLYSDTITREITKSERQLKDLKIQFKLSKALVNNKTNEEAIQQAVSQFGLIPSETKPTIFFINQDSIKNGNKR